MKNNNTIIKNLGNSIRQKRHYLGLSQTELALMAEVSLNFISQIELGKETVQLNKLLKVMTCLGLQFSLEDGNSGISIKSHEL